MSCNALTDGPSYERVTAEEEETRLKDNPPVDSLTPPHKQHPVDTHTRTQIHTQGKASAPLDVSNTYTHTHRPGGYVRSTLLASVAAVLPQLVAFNGVDIAAR